MTSVSQVSNFFIYNLKKYEESLEGLISLVDDSGKVVVYEKLQNEAFKDLLAQASLKKVSWLNANFWEGRSITVFVEAKLIQLRPNEEDSGPKWQAFTAILKEITASYSLASSSHTEMPKMDITSITYSGFKRASDGESDLDNLSKNTSSNEFSFERLIFEISAQI